MFTTATGPSRLSTPTPTFCTCPCIATTTATFSQAAEPPMRYLRPTDRPTVALSKNRFLDEFTADSCLLAPLGWQRPWYRLQRQYGLHWRTRTTHGRCRVLGSIPVISCLVQIVSSGWPGPMQASHRSPPSHTAEPVRPFVTMTTWGAGEVGGEEPPAIAGK